MEESNESECGFEERSTSQRVLGFRELLMRTVAERERCASRGQVTKKRQRVWVVTRAKSSSGKPKTKDKKEFLPILPSQTLFWSFK